MPIRPLLADPQMLQATAGPGRQLWQTGPASVIAATRRLFPHFAQGFLDITLGNTALAFELFENGFESIAQSVKHGLGLDGGDKARKFGGCL